MFPVVDVHGRTGSVDETDAIRRLAQNEIGERIGTGSGVRYQASRVAAVGSEAIHC